MRFVSVILLRWLCHVLRSMITTFCVGCLTLFSFCGTCRTFPAAPLAMSSGLYTRDIGYQNPVQKLVSGTSAQKDPTCFSGVLSEGQLGIFLDLVTYLYRYWGPALSSGLQE